MEILFNPFPGILVRRDSLESMYESICITYFTEADIKGMVGKPFVVVPSNNPYEELVFLGGTIRYMNYGADSSSYLTYGSDMIFRRGTVLTSDPVPADAFLAGSNTFWIGTTAPPEEPRGIPITLNANAEYPFEGGDGSASMYVMVNYVRIMQER